jgi:hypothetical protein
MDYLLKEDSQNPAAQLVNDFLHTATALLPTNEFGWGWNAMPASFIAIGLLIGTPFLRDHNGGSVLLVWLIRSRSRGKERGITRYMETAAYSWSGRWRF